LTHYYVFNGDADGLCALQQLRLAEPGEGTLITGCKREIALLERVPVSSDSRCTVLDISLDVNRAALLELLRAGASIRYFDHHHAGDVPEASNLQAHLDPSPSVCTSLLVDRFLSGRFRKWALVGAFGDSLVQEARAQTDSLGLDAEASLVLEQLGVCLNYNAYGESVADLHISPSRLAELMSGYDDPLEFARSSDAYRLLHAGYEEDMRKAKGLAPLRSVPGALIFLLPDEVWARRASGVLANDLARMHSNHALAILSPKTRGGYTVSVRVGRDAAVPADVFCRRFDSGGGRRTAAGINHLPLSDLERFSTEFEQQFRAER
jgi:hypothetical protein